MDSLSQIVTIGFWILGILFAIIGFFLVFYFRRSVNADDRMIDSMNDVKLEMANLRGEINSQDTGFRSFKEGCQDKHLHIDRRLSDHGKQIDDHEKRITGLEAKQ